MHTELTRPRTRRILAERWTRVAIIMINIALGRREASEASKASGMWPRGRRHKAVMHEAAVCCCLEADTTKERDRERGRQQGS